MSIEHDILSRMFKDDLEMAERLLAIRDYSLAAESLSQAIEKIHQIAAVDRAAAASKNLPLSSEASAKEESPVIDIP